MWVLTVESVEEQLVHVTVQASLHRERVYFKLTAESSNIVRHGGKVTVAEA